MKLVNTTAWDSRDLRKLVLENIKRAGLKAKGYVVEVKSAKTRECYPIRYTGLGSYFRKWIMIGIPKWKEAVGEDGHYHKLENDVVDAVRFSQVCQHELDHNRGLHHKDMPPSTTIDCSWAEAFPVGKKQEKVAEKPDLKVVRYTQTLSRIKEKQSKIKRLQNALKKLEVRRKYYEKQGVDKK